MCAYARPSERHDGQNLDQVIRRSPEIRPIGYGSTSALKSQPKRVADLGQCGARVQKQDVVHLTVRLSPLPPQPPHAKSLPRKMLAAPAWAP